MTENKIFDCIIIGAGPGGLQAAIYLGRYNRDVLLIDRGGGRTRHAKFIENFLAHRSISGNELLDLGIEQARNFNVQIIKGTVANVTKQNYFVVSTPDRIFLSKFVIVSSGVYDILPPIENVHTFLGTSFFTCIDCDGYRTTGRKLAVIGNSLNTVRLAFGMKKMFTRNVTLILYEDKVPDEYKEELANENIRLVTGRPVKIIGDKIMEAVEMQNGERIACEVIMSDFSFKLNDTFLSGLDLKRDREEFKYVVNVNYESSLNGLYIVGPLNTGPDQAIIAAGEGAVAAIDLKKRLLEI